MDRPTAAAIFAAILCCSVVAACGSAGTVTPPASAPPPPPATARPVETTTASQPAAESKLKLSDIPLGTGVVAADGTIYFDDCGTARIIRVDPGGHESLFAGAGPGGFSPGFSGENSPATEASLGCPQLAILGPDGALYFGDPLNARVRKVDQNGIISTVAGNGFLAHGTADVGDGGPAVEANVSHPSFLTFDADGNLYISDRDNDRIRRVDTNGIITTFAGTGEKGFYGDGGPATQAKFGDPEGIVFDSAGNLFVADDDNARIRKIDTSGIISTIAGTGELGYDGDGGDALKATFTLPSELGIDGEGNLYLTETDTNYIRRIGTDGIIDRFAGSQAAGNSGDGGPAVDALFSNPGFYIAPSGQFYIFDGGNGCVRTVDDQEIVATIWCVPDATP